VAAADGTCNASSGAVKGAVCVSCGACSPCTPAETASAYHSCQRDHNVSCMQDGLLWCLPAGRGTVVLSCRGVVCRGYAGVLSAGVSHACKQGSLAVGLHVMHVSVLYFGLRCVACKTLSVRVGAQHGLHLFTCCLEAPASFVVAMEGFDIRQESAARAASMRGLFQPLVLLGDHAQKYCWKTLVRAHQRVVSVLTAAVAAPCCPM